MDSIAPNAGILRRILRELKAVALASLLLAPLAASALSAWRAIGPYGGDTRAFGWSPADPRHLYLGSTASWLYESTDSGQHWQRLSRIGDGEDLVIDHILVDTRDPATLYVAGWQLDSTGGGLWISHDSGHSFAEVPALRGQSIRSLAQAPSDPAILVAGSLEGIFRSTDSGATWSPISPTGSREIHEIESLAIDPRSPDTIYAGTWHLPWKTTDGGKHWANIKNGVIDDSDVFSILIDPAHPATVYASACSGIYKSLNAGALFKKIQGIPSTARRTRVLRQDPSNPATVYAGTTEGLYKTRDAGRRFEPMTGPEIIVNDVFVDPADPSHVLLATDRGGVQVSQDGGRSFTPVNEGISSRKVEALMAGIQRPDQLWAGVVNDKTFGGVFMTGDEGRTWHQVHEGLGDRDVFSLAEAPSGTLIAGTSDGIFALETTSDGSQSWQPRSTIQNTVLKTSTVVARGKKATIEKSVVEKPRQLTGRVYELDLSGPAWLASTVDGLFTSRDQGATWQGGLVYGQSDYRSVAVNGEQMAAVRDKTLMFSPDAGRTWFPKPVPTMITQVHRVAFSKNGAIWLGAREGAFLTRDQGHTWLWIERLPFRDITDLTYDPVTDRVLATSQSSDFVYSIDPADLSWKWWQTGFRMHRVRSRAGRVLAASLYDGVLIEPAQTEPAAGQQ